MNKKMKSNSLNQTSMTPVVKDILMSYGIYHPKKSFFEQRVEREIADSFDVKAELERVKRIRNELITK